jgi:hypothetical protein
VQSPASDVTASSLQRIGAIARCERVTRSRWSAEQYSRVVGVAAAPIPILEPASQSRGERPPSHACWYVFAEGTYTEHSGVFNGAPACSCLTGAHVLEALLTGSEQRRPGRVATQVLAFLGPHVVGWQEVQGGVRCCACQGGSDRPISCWVMMAYRLEC